MSNGIAQLDLPKVRYEYFDFHNECRNMRWDRISMLIDKMKDDLEREGYEASICMESVSTIDADIFTSRYLNPHR
jgi:hypothetical protein